MIRRFFGFTWEGSEIQIFGFIWVVDKSSCYFFSDWDGLKRIPLDLNMLKLLDKSVRALLIQGSKGIPNPQVASSILAGGTKNVS
jgi:hypothetical protein